MQQLLLLCKEINQGIYRRATEPVFYWGLKHMGLARRYVKYRAIGWQIKR
jgi:hypothetical protein